MFGKYITQGNKTKIRWNDIEEAVETVMKNNK